MKHTFKLSIDCANAAFCEDDTPTPESAAPELARILRAVADRIDSGDDNLLNRIIWFATKGDTPYPGKYAGKAEEGEEE